MSEDDQREWEMESGWINPETARGTLSLSGVRWIIMKTTITKGLIGGLPKKTGFFWEISPKSVYPPTHPRVFVRFGRTKGEIRVEKGDFRGNLGGF